MARGLLIAVLGIVVVGGFVVFSLLGDEDDGTFHVDSTVPVEDEFAEGARRSAAPEITDDDGASSAGEVAPPRGGVAGRIVDESGTPIVGARVFAGPLGRRPASGFLLTATLDPDRERSATTDGDGRYVIDDCAVGEVVVAAESDVHPVSIRRGVVVVEDVVTTDVDLTLRSGRTVRGLVVDDLGDPVGGALVKLSVVTFGGDPLIGRWSPQAVTDSDGRFSIDGAEARPYRAAATRADHLPSSFANIGADWSDVVLTMSRCGRVALELVDGETGATVGDAEIAMVDDGAMETATGEQAAAIAGEGLSEGAILVHGLTAPNLRLRVTAPGRASRVVQIRGLRPGELRRLDVKLQREVVFTGRVEAEDGRRLAGAVVTVRGTPGARRDLALEGSLVGGTLDPKARREAVDDPRALVTVSVETDEEGNFRVPGLLPGDYRVEAAHPRFLPGRERAVTVDRDLPVENLLLRLRPGARIRATVTRNGAPAVGAWVVVRDPLPESRGGEAAAVLFTAATNILGRARCDANGEAVVYGIPAGSYQVFAATAGADASKWELLDRAGAPVEVTLQEGSEAGVALSAR